MFPPHGAGPPVDFALAALPSGPFDAGIKICIVQCPDAGTAPSPEAGGVLAESFARLGAETTLLDCNSNDARTSAQSFARIDLGALYRLGTPYTPVRALCAHDWLKRGSWDAIVFVEGFGVGHYAVAAKRQGLAYDNTALWVVPERPHACSLYEAQQFPEGRTDIERDFIERRTVEGADAVVMRPDIATWCLAAGWKLPARCFARPSAQLAERILAATSSLGSKPASPPMDVPLVSVCLPTFNRAALLEDAVASLERQTYKSLELVLVDDGSSDPAALACLARLEPRFAERGWQIIRQENAGPAAARLSAAAAARGSFLLFMDDDNVALGSEIATLVRAAQHAGADIVTCIPGLHASSDKGAGGVTSLQTDDPLIPQTEVDWTPVGPCLPLSVYVSCCGDNNALFRRSIFERLGGYRGEPGLVMEDVELLTRAMLAGAKIEVVPEVLFQYRKHRGSRSLGRGLFQSHLHALEPLLAAVPDAYRPILLAIRGAWYDRHRRAADDKALEDSGKAAR